jgi:putative hemolysin
MILTIAMALVSIGLLVLLSSIYSGSETGFYCVSQRRIEADAENGHNPSVWIRRLLKDETGLLISILIGNNLAIELVTLLSEHYLKRSELVGEAWLDLTVTLLLTPVLFFFAELLPKDVFRRRPYALLSWTVWPIAFFYFLFWPLMMVLRALTRAVQKVLGVQESALLRSRGREEVFEMLEESSRSGAMELRSETLARNALSLASIPLETVMTPWDKVEFLILDGQSGAEGAVSMVAKAEHSRLPVIRDGVILGYVHQLEVLGRSAEQRTDFDSILHRLDCLAPSVTVQFALRRLSKGGQRAALVGTAEAPLGLVSLKDLAERISGDLAGW